MQIIRNCIMIAAGIHAVLVHVGEVKMAGIAGPKQVPARGSGTVACWRTAGKDLVRPPDANSGAHLCGRLNDVEIVTFQRENIVAAVDVKPGSVPRYVARADVGPGVRRASACKLVVESKVSCNVVDQNATRGIDDQRG